MKIYKLFWFCIYLLCTATMLLGCSSHVFAAKNTVPSFAPSEPAQSASWQTVFATAEPETVSTVPQSTDGEGENPFASILEGTGTFLYEGNAITLADYCATFSIPVTLNAVTVVDLEWDGDPEVVLDVKTGPENSYGVLVLHLENSEVWGYTFAFRQLYKIKKDGTFTWSGSSSNNGVATLSLLRGTIEHNNQFWVEETEEGTPRFFVGGEETTSEKYYAAVADWEAKEEASWNPYPMDVYMNLF